MQPPVAGDSLPAWHHKAWQHLLPAIRPTCPRRVLGMEDAQVKAGPRKGSHVGDPLPALNTNTEIKRKTDKRQEKSVKGRMSCWSQGRTETGKCHPGAGWGAGAAPREVCHFPSPDSGTREQECLTSHERLNTQPIIAIQSQSFPPPGSAAVRGAKVSGGLAPGPPSSV